MNIYRTGEDTSEVLVLGVSQAYEPAQAEVTYAQDEGGNKSSHLRERRPANLTPETRKIQQPDAPSPSIRKALTETNDRLRLAAEAMLSAHEGDGVDVVELANAIEEYRQCVDVLWQYRQFGMEAWQSVIVFCQQALCENMQDEEMSIDQCRGLKAIATGYLANRLLAKDDVKEVMLLLPKFGFDPMLFFSHPNQVS